MRNFTGLSVVVPYRRTLLEPTKKFGVSLTKSSGVDHGVSCAMKGSPQSTMSPISTRLANVVEALRIYLCYTSIELLESVADTKRGRRR